MLSEKVLYRGWLPVDDELDQTSEDDLRLHLESMIAAVTVQAMQAPTPDPLSKLLPCLVALATAHRSAHWRALGPQWYADHLMYEKMYETVSSEIDAVAEKIVGLTGSDALIEPSYLLACARDELRNLVVPGADESSLLSAERAFLQVIAQLLDCCGSSPGVENLIQDIADAHEKHVYFLSRRSLSLKTCVPMGQR